MKSDPIILYHFSYNRLSLPKSENLALQNSGKAASSASVEKPHPSYLLKSSSACVINGISNIKINTIINNENTFMIEATPKPYITSQEISNLFPL